MSRWNWCCTIALVSASLGLAHVTSAVEQEASSAEGTITLVDLNRSDPTLTLQLPTGQSLTMLLGRIGAWNSLTVGSGVKLRYTHQKGVYTIESIEITNPAQAAAGDAAMVMSAPPPAVSPGSEEKKAEKPSTTSGTTDATTSPVFQGEPVKKKGKDPKSP